MLIILVGSSNGSALNTVEINTGTDVTAGNYEINAFNINIDDAASLTSSGLISGGDNDDSGASLKDAAVNIGYFGSLTLNTDSSIYATIDGGYGDLTINATLNSSNSHLNIGDSSILSSVTLSAGATLDVTGNNGSVKAYDIALGNSSTLKLGNTEIVGRVNGNGFDNLGTLDIQGNVTLDDGVGNFNSLALVNIGTADLDGYSVTSHNSISATNVTINGNLTSLSLDDDKIINGDVTIGNASELSLGNTSTVNGTIVGASQYQGTLTIRDGATVVAGGNIGTGALDLAEIKIHGSFDLSGLSAYEAHAQTFSLTNGASLAIGAGVIEGEIKGFADDGGATDGVGKGSVSFTANIDPTNFLVSNIGTNDGHAIAELSVGENLIVDTGSTNISASQITLYNGASLTSSASSIDGGDQISGGFSRLNTQITLNDSTSLTLNNVGTFIGTIDGNASGQGNLTLTGSYLYDDGDDAIDIGGTKKLSSITLSDSSSLDVSRWNGFVKADAITLGNGAILTVGNSDIVGTVDGASDLQGTFNILGDTTLHGAVGFTHELHQLNIGDVGKSVAVTADSSVAAVDITLSGDFTTLILSANSAVTGDVVLGETARLNFNDSASVNGTIKGAAQYNGQLNILASSSVTAHNDIGGDSFDLASVGINGGSRFDLGSYNLNAASISLIDDAELVIGGGTVTGNILGYDSSAEGNLAYGSGKGTVTFAGIADILNGNIGNDSGNAVNNIFINGGGKSLDTSGFSIYSANFTVATGSHLTVSGIIAGSADDSVAHFLTGTNLTLDDGATLTLNEGASFFGTVNGTGSLLHTGTLTIADNVTINSDISIGNSKALAAVNLGTSSTLDLSAHNNILKADLISLAGDSNLILGSGAVAGTIDGAADDSRGKLTVASSATFGAGVTFGGTHGLAEVDFGMGTVTSVANSINASTVKIIGPDSTLNLGDGSAINGNVVLDGDSILTLGDASTVYGSITNLSDSTPNGNLIIRDNATVTTNGDIGGGGYNFYGVTLNDGSNLDLSAHDNSVTSQLVQISYGATLTVGSGAVTADIQAHNSEGGTNYGLGKVVFAANNTLGGYVGVDSGATLNNVTINSGVNLDGNSHRIAALEIILQDGATLTNPGSISAGTSTEGGPIENSGIWLGDGATLSLEEISGEATLATINGYHNNDQGILQITSGNITAYGDIGVSNSLHEVDLAARTSLNLKSSDTSSAALKATTVYLDDYSSLIIGTQSVTGNIYSTGNDSGSTVTFTGATNSLAGDLGGANDNAIGNVSINTANSVAAGSHTINAATVDIGAYATLTTSGAISGGADITGTTPIATAITLQANALLVLNSGASIFGTIDGVSDADGGSGTIEVASDYTTNGNIGSINKLASVIVDDTVNLDLGTHGNSLNATTLYLGTDSTLTLGDAGTVHAAISSLSADSGVVYLNDSVTLDSGSTFGGESGLLSLYIDNAGNGNVTIDSQDSIKARNVNINGFRSALNLAANKTITGNVVLGDGSRLRLYDGSSVTGTIDSVNDSGGSLRISGDVTTQSNIGNGHILGSVTLDDGATLRLNVNDNILKSASVTLGSGSNFIVGGAEISGTFLGSVDGNGTVTFTADNVIASGTKLGDIMSLGISTSIGDVVISGGATVTQNENISSTAVTINEGGTLVVASGKGIDGDHITLGGTLIVNDSSYLNSYVQGVSGTGQLVINDDATFYGSRYLGAGDGYELASITLNSGSTVDLATSNTSANASEIILHNNSTLNIGTSTVVGTIQGNINGKGSVNFYGNNNLGGNLGISGNAVHDVTIIASDTGNTVDTQGHAIYSSGNITLGSKATLITSSSISTAASIIMNNNSNLTLEDGASVSATINAASADSAGIGTVDIASGTVTLNGSIGDVYKIKTLTIEDGATLDAATNPSSINAASISVGTGSTLSIANNSGINGNFGLRGIVNGVGTVNITADGGATYDLTATLGSTTTLSSVVFELNSSYLNVNNSIKANQVTIGGNGALMLAADQNISGDVMLGTYGTLNLKNNSSVSGAIVNDGDGFGRLIIGTNLSGPGGADASVVAHGDIGSDDYRLALIALNDNATLDLATNGANARTYDASIGANSTLIIGNSSFAAVNDLTMNQNSSITIDSGNVAANAISMALGSTITVGSGGTIYGDVHGGGAGAVTFTGDSTANGKLGTNDLHNAELLTLTINDGASLTTGYEISATAINIGDSSTLATAEAISAGTDGHNIFSSEITLGSNATLQLNNSPFVIANINGSSAGNGEIDIFGSITGNINIGNTTKINKITIDNDSFLDVATHDTSVNANNIVLAYSGVLITGNSTISAAIDGSRDNYGELLIAAGKTTTMNGDIGTLHSLNDIEINSGATLDLATNGTALNSTTTRLATNSILNVGSGAIHGNFISATSGSAGEIIFNADKTINTGVALLGNSDSHLNTVTIANSANLSISDSIYADHIKIGTTGASATSLTTTFSGAEDVIAGDTEIANRATLAIVESGFLTTGAIYGKTDGVGTLNFSGGGLLTLNGNIGSAGHALSALAIGENSSVNAYTNNASIIADDIYLSSGSNIIMGSGGLLGDVHATGTGNGVSFGAGTYSLNGNLGSALDDAAIDTVTLPGSLDTGAYDIRVNNFVLDSTDAVLNIGGGNIDIANFTNNNDGSGIINFNASNNLNFVIDTINTIAELNIANGATLNVNQFVNATNIEIGNGTSGKLILAANKTLMGDVRINSGANLTVNDGSQVLGQITGASSLGGGTFEIAASTSFTSSGYIGNSDHKLAEVKLNDDSTLNIGSSSIVSNLVSLGSGATLQVDSGTINATILGSTNGHSYGEVIFTQDNSLLQNIGSNTNKISALNINDDATLTVNHKSIYADNIALGSGATLDLQNHAFVSNNINGAGNINASGVVEVGSIGNLNALNNITTAASSTVTFNGDINTTGDFNINGNAIFTKATTAITTNSFNVNSGSSLSFALNVNSPPTSVLEVTGAAILSANTTLNLTINTTTRSGTVITLLGASNPSEIAAIANGKININNSGINMYHGQTYSTSVLDNELLLTITGNPTTNFANRNVQNTYDAIMGTGDVTGGLNTIKNYLNGDASDSAKEVAIKSVAPQVDNSSNQIAFNNVSTVANIFSARLESLRNDSGIVNSGPTFNFNNHSNQPSVVQALEPMRDNNLKPSYPLSLAINDDQKTPTGKSIWVQTFNTNINQGSQKDDGYKSNSGGVAFGIDCTKCYDFVIGASAGYAQSNISGKNSSKHINVDTYQFSIYSGYNTKSYFLNTTAGISLNNYSSNRQISLANVTAKANYSGETYAARAELGSNYKLENEIIFTPSLMITAARNTVENYSETGAGTLNLQVNNNSSNFLEGRLGAEISSLILTKNNNKIRPQAGISYGYDFIGDQQKSTSNFIGQTTTFANTGAKVAQGSLKLTTGLAFYTKDDITFSANYSFEHRTDYTSNSAWLRVIYGF